MEETARMMIFIGTTRLHPTSSCPTMVLRSAAVLVHIEYQPMYIYIYILYIVSASQFNPIRYHMYVCM